jgi:FkbM family methyltransferase
MGVADARPAARTAPWWVGGARAVVRRLPAGRFRAAAHLARLAPAPFVASLPPSLGGARFVCDLADELARDAYMAGAYEPQISFALARILSPGMTVVDVGANWGYFTLLAAGLVGPGGRVLALEPDPRMFRLLGDNIALNGFARAGARLVAAAERNGVGTLAGYAEGAGNRGVSRLRSGEGPDFVEVRLATIGAILADERIEMVDVIKIDVEGAEDGVLLGMRDGLRNGSFRRILLELHPSLLAERGRTADECCGMLREAGYEGWAFDHSPAARRRAAYARDMRLGDLLHRADRVPPGDPWPHMLWTRPGLLAA